MTNFGSQIVSIEARERIRGIEKCFFQRRQLGLQEPMDRSHMLKEAGSGGSVGTVGNVNRDNIGRQRQA